MSIKLLVGLGNPGREYELTRHNTGFLVLDKLSKCWSVKFKTVKEFNSQIAMKIFNNQSIYLFKPLTFVNLCGSAVKKFTERNFIALSEILVICDDFSLPFGKLRLRQKGSSGGHKGLKSIIEHLGSSEFARLRIGIGAVPVGQSAEDFVLSEFTQKEKIKLKDIIEFAVLSIEKIFQEGELNLRRVMEFVNSKPPLM